MAGLNKHQEAFGLFSTLVEMDEDANGVVTKIEVENFADIVEASSDYSSITTSARYETDFCHWPTVLLVTFSIITVMINLLLLILFTKRRCLRTVSNRFVINLLFISLLSSAILVPFVILDIESEALTKTNTLDVRLSNLSLHSLQDQNKSWDLWTSQSPIRTTPLPELFKELTNKSITSTMNIKSFLAQFVLNCICTASILSILLIGIDQYLAVLHPLRCHSYMNKAKSLLLILTSYVISLASASLVSVMNWNKYFFVNLSKDNAERFLFDYGDQSKDINYWSLGYGIFYLSTIIVTPFITICIIYVLIYRAAHRNSARLRRSNFETPKRITLPKVQSAPNFVTNNVNENQIDPLVSTPKEISLDLTRISKVCKANKIERTHSDRIPNIITSLKSKISSASAFRYREENRTAKISIIVIVMVLACYAPYGVVFLLGSIKSSVDSKGFAKHDSFLIFNKISIMLLISANLWSPILFALRNRRVQRELKKFLTLALNVIMLRSHAQYPVSTTNRRHSRPQIVIQDIETTLNSKRADLVQMQIEPFLGVNDDLQADLRGDNDLKDFSCNTTKDKDSKSILKRVCSKNWGSYKKCSFINVPDGCLDARGSFSSASTQISTEE